MMEYLISISLALLGMVPVILLDVRPHLVSFNWPVWLRANGQRLLAAIMFLIAVITISHVSPQAQTLLAMVIPINGETMTAPGAVMLGVTTASLFITTWKKTQ